MNHIQMPVCHGDVHRLANGASRRMHGGAQVREFYKIAKILEGSIATTSFEIVHEGSPIARSKHSGVPTDLKISGGVPGMLGKDRRRRFGDQLPAKASWKVDPLAVHLRPGLGQSRQGAGVATKIDPHFFQDQLGVGLNQAEAFLGKNLQGTRGPSQIRENRGAGLGSGGFAGRAPTLPAAPIGPLHP